MRLLEYNSLDEILEDSRYVTMTHCGTKPISWMPDRLKILGILGNEFAIPLVDNFNRYSAKIISAKIFPSEIIKAAHNFQISMKQTNDRDVNVICETYFNLVNLGIKKRRHMTKMFCQTINNYASVFILKNAREKRTLLFFSALLRAISEVLYFDNHTTCGDTFLINSDGYIVVKSYSDVFSRFLYHNQIKYLPFKAVNIYLIYERLDAKFDMIGNCYSNIDINSSLFKYSIEIINFKDEVNYVRVDEIDYIIKILSDLLEKYSRRYKTLDEIAAIELIVRCIFQVNKPLFDSISMPYDYSDSQFSKIISNYYNPMYCDTAEVFRKYSYNEAIEIIIDPRKEI